MAFAAALSTHPVAAHATGEVVGQLLEGAGRYPDLVVLAVTPAHAGALEDIGAAFRRLLAPTVLLGAVVRSLGAATAVVGKGPGVAAWSATCGPVVPLRLPPVAAPGTWARPPFEARATIVLAAAGHDAEGPVGVGPVVGGATGGLLLLDGDVHTAGAVGAVLGPGAEVRVETFHGLRPLGPELVVERAAYRMLQRLAGVAAFDRLVDLARDGVPAAELPGIGRGLHVAVLDPPGALARLLPVLGTDRSTGALAIGGEVETGAIVRFFVRAPEMVAHQAAAGPARAADAAIAFGPPEHAGELLRPGSELAVPTAGPVDRDPILPVAALYLEASLQLAGTGTGIAVHEQASTVALFSEP
jgi:small ligand-binding sensory domain FIST